MGVRQLESPRRATDQSARPESMGSTRRRALLDLMWSDWRVGLGAAIALAAGFGLISGWLTPRGPITTYEALISIGAALGIGIGAGLVMANRWSLLAAPVEPCEPRVSPRRGASGLALILEGVRDA